MSNTPRRHQTRFTLWDGGRKLRLQLMIAVSFSLLAGAACDRGTDEETGAPGAEEYPMPETSSPEIPSPDDEPSNPDVQLTRYERTTTPGEIARRNLDGQIQAAERTAQRRDHATNPVVAYVNLLKTRVQFYATYSDFDAAFEAIEAMDDAAQESPEAQRMLAGVEGAVHRFEEARSRIEMIDGELDTDSLQILALAVGDDLDPFVVAAKEEADERPTYEHFVSLASLQAAQGDFADADASYRSAIEAYTSVSPYPIAWVQFQRGVMWAERAGRSENAVPLYEDAVRMVPNYVVASVHLAELQAENGDVNGAIARLERIAEATEDPEPSALLSELYEETGDTEKAAAAARRADRMYGELLNKYPAAFADHATEFYLASGNDPSKAWTLASGNLVRRQDARARLLAVEAAFAAGEDESACEVLSGAQDSHAVAGSVPLREAITMHAEQCNLESVTQASD